MIDELRQALLAETEPAPGMADRVLAGFHPHPRPRRASWLVGALAVVLALLIVATLVVAGRAYRRPTIPATTPTPGVTSPPVASAVPLAGAAFAADGSGWALEQTRLSLPAGDLTVYRTTDGGAHWSSQLTLAHASGNLRAGPGGQALLYVEVASGGTTTPPVSYFYSTADGGAHWQRSPSPVTGVATSVTLDDAREAWVAGYAAGPAGKPTEWIFYRTVDGGRTWQRAATIDPATFGSGGQGPMLFMDPSHAMYFPADPATGPGVLPLRIFVTSDGGAHWTQVRVPAPPGQSLTSAVAAATVAAALPGDHVVLQVATGLSLPGSSRSTRDFLAASHDGGLHWSPPLPAPSATGELTALDDAHWWWFGADGQVWLSGDEGQLWSPAGRLPGGVAPGQADFTSPTDGWLLGTYLNHAQTVLLLTADGGRTWRPVAPPHAIRPAVPCDAAPDAAVTAHAHLTLVLDGKAQPFVPAGAGETGGCRYRLFTTDASGTIDVAATPAERGRRYTLGDFFDVWGVTDLQAALPSYASNQQVTVTVDGRPYAGDPRSIPLRDGTTIVVSVTARIGTG